MEASDRVCRRRHVFRDAVVLQREAGVRTATDGELDGLEVARHAVDNWNTLLQHWDLRWNSTSCAWHQDS
jgi:hypothetical protein